MSDVIDALVNVDIALNEELGPRTYNNPVEVAMRDLATALGIDWREIGEITYHKTGGQE